MSDNIDYAELDRAVNEAIKNRSASAQSSIKTAAKPVAKAAIKPVAKTASRPTTRTTSQSVTVKTTPARSHGQFMDIMMPRATTSHSATPRAIKPVAKTAPRPAIKPLARTTTPPVATKITAMPRPAITTHSAKVAAATPRASRPSVATQIQQRQQRVATQPYPPTRPQSVRPTSANSSTTQTAPARSTQTPTRTPISTQTPADTTKTTAPNANNYSLGVRSPFITNAKVEKRPLGTDIPETAASAIHSTKNIYSAKSPSKSTKAAKKHMVTEAPKKHSGWLWTLLVLLVIAAGGGLGYLAYILVFANQF